jgi:hypothetical protein
MSGSIEQTVSFFSSTDSIEHLLEAFEYNSPSCCEERKTSASRKGTKSAKEQEERRRGKEEEEDELGIHTI